VSNVYIKAQRDTALIIKTIHAELIKADIWAAHRENRPSIRKKARKLKTNHIGE